MKTKLVLWATTGSNESRSRVLLALDLRADDNKYDIWAIPEEGIADDLESKLMKNWRDGEEVAFPENATHVERDLTASEEMLPEEYTPENEGLLSRAKIEWQFIVLATKVYNAYKQEAQELKERVSTLTIFDKNVWDELKGFWQKVQDQLRDRSLYREQADELKTHVNGLFEDLKALRTTAESELENEFRNGFDKLNGALSTLETKLNEGKADLYKIFGELKNLQSDYHNTKLSFKNREEIWQRLDGAFKKAKQMKFGENQFDDRLSKRIEGLQDAMKKIQDSLSRDERELNDLNSRITSGKATQLEIQLREAKVSLMQDRLKGKREKLADMQHTLDDLQKKLEKEDKNRAKMEAQNEAKAKAEARIKAEAKENEEKAKESMEKAMATVKPAEETVVEKVEVVEEVKEETPVEETKEETPVAETPVEETPETKEDTPVID